ncbi:HSP20 family protein [Jannaschia faecimaris]|uniref:HSP20 family protein n=1 Tax=Jannaschia faecimaris TaxID=1244108 RepID=A0A1H3Q1N4_9RHOB|nr:Hsp20/alpha crystallin family protein [Jannaschia faecimaris]SDZ06945.1 HSP20 family protein [Jannaschia faecimaris]
MLQTLSSPLSTDDPFADMRRMQIAMNRLFDGVRTPGTTANYPPINFWAGPDSVVMTAELPGVTEQDIELTVKDTMLSMRVTCPEAATGDDIVWHRRERVDGSFLRSLELPFRVNPDHIDARFADGILTVEMQRPEDDKPKHIQIKAS